eukprot:TRINITY_DN15878_c0_g1_i1.p1 TRINITY_DN15878_c0_g1~~TRINITY_DN15878_c0_g1_i1.p1  ORF type:complete len:544 (+),score=89.39 TRINITY_DN15878_c0_g1_i1:30-1661(+)
MQDISRPLAAASANNWQMADLAARQVSEAGLAMQMEFIKLCKSFQHLQTTRECRPSSPAPLPAAGSRSTAASQPEGPRVTRRPQSVGSLKQMRQLLARWPKDGTAACDAQSRIGQVLLERNDELRRMREKCQQLAEQHRQDERCFFEVTSTVKELRGYLDMVRQEKVCENQELDVRAKPIPSIDKPSDDTAEKQPLDRPAANAGQEVELLTDMLRAVSSARRQSIRSSSSHKDVPPLPESRQSSELHMPSTPVSTPRRPSFPSVAPSSPSPSSCQGAHHLSHRQHSGVVVVPASPLQEIERRQRSVSPVPSHTPSPRARGLCQELTPSPLSPLLLPAQQRLPSRHHLQQQHLAESGEPTARLHPALWHEEQNEPKRRAASVAATTPRLHRRHASPFQSSHGLAMPATSWLHTPRVIMRDEAPLGPTAVTPRLREQHSPPSRANSPRPSTPTRLHQAHETPRLHEPRGPQEKQQRFAIVPESIAWARRQDEEPLVAVGGMLIACPDCAQAACGGGQCHTTGKCIPRQMFWEKLDERARLRQQPL